MHIIMHVCAYARVSMYISSPFLFASFDSFKTRAHRLGSNQLICRICIRMISIFPWMFDSKRNCQNTSDFGMEINDKKKREKRKSEWNEITHRIHWSAALNASIARRKKIYGCLRTPYLTFLMNEVRHSAHFNVSAWVWVSKPKRSSRRLGLCAFVQWT